jgi:peptidase M15-like protein
MAETIGDIIGRNYRSGRAIGDDFSESRFSRGALKIKQKYTELAANTPDKTLEDFLPDIEDELEKLAVKTGAVKRHLQDSQGRALQYGAAESIYGDVTRASERRASQALLGGDVGGALGMRARTQGNIGNFDAAAQQQQASQRVGATSSALDAQGNYVPSEGAQNMANVNAQYGQGEQAAAQTQQSDSFRLQEAAKYADQMYRMASNPKMFDPDQFAGTFEAFKSVVPEVGNMDLRLDPDGKSKEPILIYQNGQATDSLSLDEFASMAQQFTAQPGQSVGSYMQARTTAIADEKARQTKTSERFSNARIDVVKQLVTDFKMPADVAEAAVGFSTKSGGWQLQDMGTEPGQYLVNKNGKTYVIKTNVQADPELGIPGGTVQIEDLDGNPVPAGALDSAGVRSAALDLANAQMASGFEMKGESVKAALQVLNSLEAQEMGGAPQASTSNGGGQNGALPKLQGPATGDVADVQSDYQTLADMFGMEVTSTKRSPGENTKVGGVSNSQHVSGTAADFRTKGVPEETIEAFMAEARAAGYEVIDERNQTRGTGPHIHIELPKGGRRQAAAAPRAAASGTGALGGPIDFVGGGLQGEAPPQGQQPLLAGGVPANVPSMSDFNRALRNR